MESIQDFYSMWNPHGMRGHGKVLRQIKVTSVILIRSRFVNICTENSVTWQLISDDIVT